MVTSRQWSSVLDSNPLRRYLPVFLTPSLIEENSLDFTAIQPVDNLPLQLVLFSSIIRRWKGMAEDERLELSHAFTWTVFKTAAVPIMLNPPYVVELSGLEPLTPCVQSKCSPYWAIAPYGTPRGTRTLDSRLKRALLYQLSYWRVYYCVLYIWSNVIGL